MLRPTGSAARRPQPISAPFLAFQPGLAQLVLWVHNSQTNLSTSSRLASLMQQAHGEEAVHTYPEGRVQSGLKLRQEASVACLCHPLVEACLPPQLP